MIFFLSVLPDRCQNETQLFESDRWLMHNQLYDDHLERKKRRLGRGLLYKY